MAKKTKRKVSSGVRPDVTPVTEPVVETAPRAAGAPTFRRAAATPAEFNPDYSYVIQDLKRIGVLAGSFLVVLIILSFIIK